MMGMGATIEYRAWLNQQLVRLAYEISFVRFVRAIKSLGGHYNPDQPRDWHGRWTIDGGEAGLADLSSLAELAGRGHHYVPRKIFQSYNLSSEAMSVFEGATTGHLRDASSNYYDDMHREYSKAVGETFKEYLSKNQIDPENMTKAEAEKFVDQVKRSTEPRIQQFNKRIWMREIMRSIRLFRGRE